MSEPVLLVEDDGATRLKLTALLEELGYPVRACSNGVEAWSAFDAEPARIVISDWKMPGLDGTQFCLLVRRRPQTLYTYFLLITANDPGVLGYDLSVGSEVDDFLIKPVHREQLWRRMRVAERIVSFTTQLRQLESLLPICAYCHRIRDERDEHWEPVEDYVRQRTGSEFTHGICPDCERRAMEQLRSSPRAS